MGSPVRGVVDEGHHERSLLMLALWKTGTGTANNGAAHNNGANNIVAEADDEAAENGHCQKCVQGILGIAKDGVVDDGVKEDGVVGDGVSDDRHCGQ